MENYTHGGGGGLTERWNGREHSVVGRRAVVMLCGCAIVQSCGRCL